LVALKLVEVALTASRLVSDPFVPLRFVAKKLVDVPLVR
jgi:hypothetical protein